MYRFCQRNKLIARILSLSLFLYSSFRFIHHSLTLFRSQYKVEIATSNEFNEKNEKSKMTIIKVTSLKLI